MSGDAATSDVSTEGPRREVAVEASVRVSVVLPVCDNVKFIEASIRSVLRQDAAPDEVVIGDDGSSDGTSEIIDRLARESPLIRVMRRERRSGHANSANWVVKAARGDLIALANGDDLSFSDRLRLQTAALTARPAAVLIGAPAIGIDNEDRQVHPANLWRLVAPSAFSPFAHSSIMFRRQAFEQAGGYRAEAEYWEDLDLMWRLARIGPILVLPRAVTAYRYSSDSFRSRDRAAEVEDAVQRMYDQAALVGTGGLTAATTAAATSTPEKISPRVFIARSWVRVWAGQRPGTLRRLLHRGRLGLDWGTAVALVFVTGGTVAPRLFRKSLQVAAVIRNAIARLWLKPDALVEWRPFESDSR